MSKMQNCIESFLETLSIEKNLSSNTTISYTHDLEQISKYFYPQNLLTLNSNDLTNYIIYLNTKYSSSTRARKISAIKGYYRFLYNEKLITNNPALKLESVKKTAKLPNYLTRDEIQKLLQHAANKGNFSGQRNYAILEILYATGMRISEIIALKMHEVLPVLNGAQHIVICGKGNKERIIIFTEKSIIALKQYVSLIKNNKTQWLCLNRNDFSDTPLSRQAVGKILKKLAVELLIDPMKISPHIIRHSFATHLLNAGMKIKIIKELLGHASISTTQIYTHIADDKLKQILEDHHPLADKKLIK